MLFRPVVLRRQWWTVFRAAISPFGGIRADISLFMSWVLFVQLFAWYFEKEKEMSLVPCCCAVCLSPDVLDAQPSADDCRYRLFSHWSADHCRRAAARMI